MSGSKNILRPQNWVTLYADALYLHAFHKTGKQELAEDLVQETFLAGLRSASNFKGNSSEKTWLFNILKFKIADYYRKASTKYELSASFISTSKSNVLDQFFNKDGEWLEDSGPQAWSEDAIQLLENKELGDVLNNCIDKLTNDQKQVILLKMLEETDTKIVCKELNITPTNYWVLIHRAKLILRACIEKNWFKA